ncbi:MAG TPA: M20/M25/M40 family metallo-hydrolase [Solirubrobacteraceae bacterium]|nr:M20/M25/M40 family metallo-hydrolase [Solirubrobacteraceae bacterium]
MRSAQPLIGASPQERRRLGELFVELCRIESPSGRERACAERVVQELLELGLEVHEDEAGPQAGSDCGNLLVRIPAREEGPSFLLCAHMDTVPLAAPVEPVLLKGGYENANEGILGADNKAAIAVLLALARRLCESPPPVGVELLFTVGEERALAGARAFDAGGLRSELGYVFDHASPIGEVIVASPFHFRVEISFRGAAAHSGVRPQDGRSAILAAARAVAEMPLGRVDGESTVNVGRIEGGSAMNVVPERCTLIAEVRSLQAERAEGLVSELIERAQDAANLPECECDVDVALERTFAGYWTPEDAPAVRAALGALERCSYEPRLVASGGGSDANALIAQGLPTVNLANGTERNHEPGERVSVAALEGVLDVALALPDAVAEQAPSPAR